MKDIELSDLDEYDMEALRSGGFQVLPKRDLAGRNVLFGRYTAMRYREIKNMVRLSLISCAVEMSEEVLSHTILPLTSYAHCGIFG